MFCCELGQLYRLHNILPRATVTVLLLVPPNIAGVLGVLLVQVQLPREQEVLPVLVSSQGGHHVQRPVSYPAVLPVVSHIVQILLGWS